MSIEIRFLSASEADVLGDVAPGTFDNPIHGPAAEAFLRDERHHLAVAIEDGVVVGFVSSVHYVHPDKPRPQMWINEVQTAPTHRRRGFARALVDATLARGRELGCTEAWLLTNRGNVAAERLYESCGGREGKSDDVMYTFAL